MNAFIPLHTFLDSLLPLTENQKKRFSSLITTTTLTKGEHLLRAGDSLSYLYFCLSGCFRLYYSTYDGKERIKSFCAANDFITSYTALLTGKALRYQLEATKVKVFEIIPPLVSTEMTAGRGKGKISTDQLVNEFVRGFERDRYEILIGKIKLLHLIQRISPSLADKLLKNG